MHTADYNGNKILEIFGVEGESSQSPRVFEMRYQVVSFEKMPQHLEVTAFHTMSGWSANLLIYLGDPDLRAAFTINPAEGASRDDAHIETVIMSHCKILSGSNQAEPVH